MDIVKLTNGFYAVKRRKGGVALVAVEDAGFRVFSPFNTQHEFRSISAEEAAEYAANFAPRAFNNAEDARRWVLKWEAA